MILSMIIFGAALVLLVVILAGVPVNQRAINILFLIFILLIGLSGTGWIQQLK